MIAGSDEAGKGDYFGYVVVACVCCDPSFLNKLEIRDSKTLSERQILRLEGKIKKNCIYSLVSVSPARYNQLHKATGGRYNLNQILGWMHAKAITEVMEKCPSARVVVDKFGKEENVLNNLSGEVRERVAFLTKGERDPAVAAASIVARAEFLRKHALLSRRAAMSLPFGSTHVKDAAREFVRKHGKEALEDVAKIHFKITQEL
jgi:ribonuclease HIII